jgi:chemotaxis protein CheD
MLALEGELSDIYLHPGESHLARTPAVIRTILGSCVGVTFWSRKLRIGALCHAQLPRCPSPKTVSTAEGHRYVDFAIRDLARQFTELGVPRSELQVKMFGGADVLVVADPASATIGRMNCDMAVAVAKAEGLHVVASSLGGTSGLNIRFHTITGEVLLRRLSPLVSEDIAEGGERA